MTPNEAKLSRRDMVAAGTGMLASPLLAALGGNAAAAAESGNGNGASSFPGGRQMTNPLTEYPRPPFKKQSQPSPGLARDMEPRPDHGETSYKGSGRLIGRKALITGGDSGIGRAAAIAYAREGADVAINYLPFEEPDAKEVVDLIKAEGRKAIAIPGDLKDEKFCNQLVSDAVDQLGGLDILVSNAAKQVAQASLADISTEQFDATMKTNLYGMFWMVKAALPHLKPGASVICTTSINAYDPEPYIVDYAMTKGAIAIFIKAMSKQLIGQGIRVNGVAPGPIWTPLQPSGGQLPDKLPQFGADTPYKRPGQPAELAAVYVLLASQESSYVSGEIYGITGGHPTA